ncbi:IucA/IucC family siderophore biosynthesis protein [Haloterrigena sp. SYSU A121-1]|uniref:IucA/IucC family siderophore biosynthesis protein n=1 Tax=Haloterrigena gelatinilytica TaxID=2741724 RepID=A0A8J8GKR5_9EURY|nr:IucA/IucC family protein [Haloterrigena gelatinilytica]NUB91020.1 IucA/IucC family siderophore biosynthesis protein [Haloterrigena gelatinilytica]
MTGTNRGPRDRPTLRTAAERATVGTATRYARTHDLSQPAEAAYLEALEGSRREICHRFARGILRGDPAGFPAARFVDLESTSAVADAIRTSAIASVLEGGSLESVADAVVAAVPESCRRLAVVPCSDSGTLLFVPIERRQGYDRYQPVGPLYRWTAGDLTALDHPVDLVPILECEGAFSDAEQAERIRGEVAESVANLALARLAGDAHARTVARDGSADRSPLEAVADGMSAADDAAAFERIVTDGHPFHPSGKIRRGMTPAEGLAYAPEFTDRIDLRFVAIDREYALETSAGDRSDGGERSVAEAGERLTERLLATFDGLEDALERALPADRDPDACAVVPVHPLQYHRTIPDRYADRIDDGRVVPIPDYAHPATPQLNLRTVVPYDIDRTAHVDGPLPHLKLAIPVQTTNVVRTLSPHAVANGPQVTDVVRAIAERVCLESLGLLAEPAATCYHAPGGPHPCGEAYDDARHLSGLLRTNPAAHPLVRNGPDSAYPVVASSLVADSPVSGRPLVCDLIERYATARGRSDRADAALAFLERYAAVVVPEQLRLCCKYGIALESHLQNSLVVFDAADATPTATLIRDLGGIRVHEGRLETRELSIDPYPDSDLEADGEADLHRKLYYALFQNHLAELVATVCHELEVDERACWERIREQCERAFADLRADEGVPEERIRRDEHALFDEPATHKALTAMRLRGKRHEYVTSEVSNPLSRFDR